MDRYYITHTDDAGERHQLTGAWDAESPKAAIAQMLAEAREDDDGRWEAHVITPPTLAPIDLAELDATLDREARPTDASDWTAWEAEYAGATVSNQTWHIVHSASIQRGGIVLVGSGSSGATMWTDAETPGEVLARMLADDLRA